MLMPMLKRMLMRQRANCLLGASAFYNGFTLGWVKLKALVTKPRWITCRLDLARLRQIGGLRTSLFGHRGLLELKLNRFPFNSSVLIAEA